MSARLVVVVCTGNICRSPMAEVFLREHLMERGVADVEVVSAGTHAVDGGPAMPESVAAVAAIRGALEGHASRRLDLALARRADLILCAADEHARTIRRWWPEVEAGKVALFEDARGAGGDVGDPLGGGLAVFLETARRIDRAMAAWAERIAAR